ncbi:MAG: hypothetical protein KF906_08370 [Actinobacteria bacterium]|nr:hypothetical protein [Actinomycetota bacterium]
MGTRRTRVFVTSIILVMVGASYWGYAAVAADESPPEFGIMPDEDRARVPDFVAVSDGKGGIAGYAENALLDGSALLPTSPTEAAEWAEVEGIIVRVFDLNGRHIGYFATDHTFIDEAKKDELMAAGFRYFEGHEPTTSNAQATRLTPTPAETVSPSTLPPTPTTSVDGP